MDLTDIKRQIAQVVRTLSGGGILTLTVGHVSCRIPGTDRIAMLGHAHKAYKTLDMVTEEDIIVIDADGNLVEGQHEAAGEKFIHTAVYRARPEVGSVIHGHPYASMPFGVANVKLVPVFHRAQHFEPEVPVLDYAGQIDTPELGERVARALGGAPALLLRGHGVVVTGASVEEAGVNAFALERNAEIQLAVAALGVRNPAPLQDIPQRTKHTSVWRYYVKTFDPMFSAGTAGS